MNFHNTNLEDSEFRLQQLSGARFDGCNLSNARFFRSCLKGASFRGANLTGAIFCEVDCTDADFDGAQIAGVNFHDVVLNGVDLSRASTDDIREDLWDILDRARSEVPGVLRALRAGQIDGSSYTHGPCVCLVGTIAALRHCETEDLQVDGIPENPYRPAELWFRSIRPGHTPDNNPFAALAEEWILEWQRQNRRGRVQLRRGGSR